MLSPIFLRFSEALKMAASSSSVSYSRSPKAEPASQLLERAAQVVPHFKEVLLSNYNGKVRKVFKVLENFSSVYTMGRKLGEGMSGAVFEAFDHQMGKSVALKIITPRSYYNIPYIIEPEIFEIISSNHIQGVPLYYDSFVVRKLVPRGEMSLVIAMELVQGRSLEDVIADADYEGIPAKVQVTFSYWLFSVLENLHHLGIVHRDIKPANIIVRDSGSFCLLDFGLACFWEQLGQGITELHCKDAAGTPLYSSPESLAEYNSSLPPELALKEYVKGLSPALDVWSAAMVIMEVGEPDFPDRLLGGISTREHLREVISHGIQIEEPDEEESPEPDLERTRKLFQLLNLCFVADPHQRIEASKMRELLEELLDERIVKLQFVDDGELDYSDTLDDLSLDDRSPSPMGFRRNSY